MLPNPDPEFHRTTKLAGYEKTETKAKQFQSSNQYIFPQTRKLNEGSRNKPAEKNKK